MMGKRDALHAILNGQRADRIPVIMNAFSLPVARYGYTMAQVMQQPDKMVECMVGTDGSWDMMACVLGCIVELQDK